MELSKFCEALNSFAPFSLSEELCEKENGYDNSGLIFEGSKEVEKVLFTLDLTVLAVKVALKIGANLIVTHHPAIYNPIKKIDGALALAVQNGISIISTHLNMDVAEQGVDYFLAKGLGGDNQEILHKLSSGGYGRRFNVSCTLGEMEEKCKSVLGSDKVICYGNKSKTISTVTTFCGAGFDEDSLGYESDLIISADAKHHLILQAIDQGKSIILITHYAGENYGFKKAVEQLMESEELSGLGFAYLNDDRLI